MHGDLQQKYHDEVIHAPKNSTAIHIMVLKNAMCGSIETECAYALMSYYNKGSMDENGCRDRCPDEWDAGLDDWQDPCQVRDWDDHDDFDHDHPWEEDNPWDDDDHPWDEDDHWDNWDEDDHWDDHHWDDDHWDDEHRDQTLDDLWDDHAVSEHFE